MKKLLIIIIPFVICTCILFYSHKINNENGAQVSKNFQVKPPTIIIDAGHGGFDGGTSSEDGTPEKDINLKISLYLRDYLEFLGLKTVLTREEDESLEDEGLTTIRARKTSDIHNRMALMEKTDNALFVSIHQNHFSVEKYKGLQVFYSPNFSEKSSLLATKIQENVVELLQPENDRQVTKCGTSVYLMYNAVKPAVLVECGFLSNKEEAELLKTDEYCKKIAFSIAIGIFDYIRTEKNG